jgi:quinol monooxygenase YgiN
MNSDSLTVFALFKARPGKEAALKNELLALIPPTRQESGCLNYDLHVDVADPAKFIFHENWKSKAHLDAHLANSHLQAFVAKMPDLLAEPLQIILAEKIG